MRYEIDIKENAIGQVRIHAYVYKTGNDWRYNVAIHGDTAIVTESGELEFYENGLYIGHLYLKDKNTKFKITEV